MYCFCILLFSLTVFSQNKLDVYFDFNQNVPNEQSQIKINQWVLDNKSIEITKIFGYCDSVDDRKYNKDLAMRRVNSMIEIFNKNNIKIADKVALRAFGSDFKFSKNQSENRKVEVFYNLSIIEKPEVKNTKTIPDGPFGKRQVKEAIAEETSETEILNLAYRDVLIEEENL